MKSESPQQENKETKDRSKSSKAKFHRNGRQKEVKTNRKRNDNGGEEANQRIAKEEPKEEETENKSSQQIKSRRRQKNVRGAVVWRAFPRLARWLHCPDRA